MVGGEATGGMTTKPPPWEAREAKKSLQKKLAFLTKIRLRKLDRNLVHFLGPSFFPIENYYVRDTWFNFLNHFPAPKTEPHFGAKNARNSELHGSGSRPVSGPPS